MLVRCRLRSGSDQARALWSGFLLCWDSAWWWFGRVVYRQDGPQPDQSKGTHRQAGGVKTRRCRQKSLMTEGRGRHGQQQAMDADKLRTLASLATSRATDRWWERGSRSVEVVRGGPWVCWVCWGEGGGGIGDPDDYP